MGLLAGAGCSESTLGGESLDGRVSRRRRQGPRKEGPEGQPRPDGLSAADLSRPGHRPGHTLPPGEPPARLTCPTLPWVGGSNGAPSGQEALNKNAFKKQVICFSFREKDTLNEEKLKNTGECDKNKRYARAPLQVFSRSCTTAVPHAPVSGPRPRA